MILERTSAPSPLALSRSSSLRDVLLRKYCFSFGSCPNYLPPQFGQLVQLFSDAKIQDLKDSLGLKPKKQFKVQIIGILEKIDS